MGKVIMSGVSKGMTVPVKPTLNECTWDQIKAISDAGIAASVWSVGDCKEIVLNGTVGALTLSKYLTCVYIIGFDHNAELEGAGITFGTFKTALTDGVDVALVDSYYGAESSTTSFRMRSTSTNSGGWNKATIRTMLGSTESSKESADTLMAAFPSELRSVIKPMQIYTDNTGGASDDASNVTATVDYLPLLAEFEVFGIRKSANKAEQNYQQQYAYYANGNSMIKFKHDSTTTAICWWLRSVPTSNYGGFIFKRATADGYGIDPAKYSYGIAPIFRV